MLPLKIATSPRWIDAVLADVDGFLQDHAANERKVCGSALKLAIQYPERTEVVSAMIDLAREELEHFKLVFDVLVSRGRGLAQDTPDPYMGALHRVMRKARMDDYLSDRLLTFSIVEARACERFALLAEAFTDPFLADLYARLTRAEARHHALFLRHARQIAPADATQLRLDELLSVEAEIVAALPIRAALH